MKKTRAEMIRECEDPESALGHVAVVAAERQALALEGVEDALARIGVPVTPQTDTGRLFHVEPNSYQDSFIITDGAIVFTVHFSYATCGPQPSPNPKEIAYAHAVRLAALLNRYWSE